MSGLTATRVPTGTAESGPVSMTVPPISWPSRNGNAWPRGISVGAAPMFAAKRWRSLPQIPPACTSTRAQSPRGSAGSSSSTREAGNPGSV